MSAVGLFFFGLRFLGRRLRSPRSAGMTVTSLVGGTSSVSFHWLEPFGIWLSAGVCLEQLDKIVSGSLTPRWSQRRLPLEFMDGLSYTTIIEPAEPLARRRGSALDR